MAEIRILQTSILLNKIFTTIENKIVMWVLISIALLVIETRQVDPTLSIDYNNKILQANKGFQFGSIWLIEHIYDLSGVDKILLNVTINGINYPYTTNNPGCGDLLKMYIYENLTLINKLAVTQQNKSLVLYNWNFTTTQLLWNVGVMADQVSFRDRFSIYVADFLGQKLYHINMTTNTFIRNVSFSAETIKGYCFDSNIILMTQNFSDLSMGNFHIYNPDLSLNKTIPFQNYHFEEFKQLSYNHNQNLLIRISGMVIEVWNVTAMTIVYTFDYAPGGELQPRAGIVCQGVFFVFGANRYQFFQVGTWINMGTSGFYSNYRQYSRLKCFALESMVGIAKLVDFMHIQIEYLTFNYTASQNTTNITINNSTNSTLNATNNSSINATLNVTANITANETANNTGNLTGNSMANNTGNLTGNSTANSTMNSTVNSTGIKNTSTSYISNNSSNISTNLTNSSTSPSTTPTPLLAEDKYKQLQIICTTVKEAVFSESVAKSMKAASSISGITSASFACRSSFRPFISFLEDFWFYGFHGTQYPDFVDTFAKEVDLLNELRLKPEMFNIQLNIQKYQKQNDLFNNTNILQQRAPDKIFFLLSVQDIYTTNFSIVLVMFIILNILCILVNLIKKKHQTIQKFHKFLTMHSMWWTLLVGFCETNIAPIAFYSAVQMNVFVSFDFFGKVNLCIAVIGLFIVFAFSFLYYPIVSRYESKEVCAQVLDFSDLNQKSFWLQMSLKSVRSLFQALIHGFFINQHYFQLLGLILLDNCMIAIILILRKMFTYKISCILVIMYFLCFLAFDIGLLTYTINLNFGDIIDSQKVTYDFAFIVIILALFGLTIVRVIVSLGISLYHAVKINFFDNKSKISDSLALKNRQQNRENKNKMQTISKIQDLKKSCAKDNQNMTVKIIFLKNQTNNKKIGTQKKVEPSQYTTDKKQGKRPYGRTHGSFHGIKIHKENRGQFLTSAQNKSKKSQKSGKFKDKGKKLQFNKNKVGSKFIFTFLGMNQPGDIQDIDNSK